MLLRVPAVLTAEQLARCRDRLGECELDRRTCHRRSSIRARQGKRAARGRLVRRARTRRDHRVGARAQRAAHIRGFAAQDLPAAVQSLPRRTGFGVHVDNAVRLVRAPAQRVRTDLSATLFLSEPDEYDGGELVIEDTYGSHSVKLPAAT